MIKKMNFIKLRTMDNIPIKLIFFIWIILAFTNCGVFNTLKYDFALMEISETKNSMDYGELSFADSLIDISFTINKKEISFSLRNLSSNTLKINWDETLYISEGNTGKVMHGGIK